jgi:hypothetical protein
MPARTIGRHRGDGPLEEFTVEVAVPGVPVEAMSASGVRSRGDGLTVARRRSGWYVCSTVSTGRSGELDGARAPPL